MNSHSRRKLRRTIAIASLPITAATLFLIITEQYTWWGITIICIGLTIATIGWYYILRSIEL